MKRIDWKNNAGMYEPGKTPHEQGLPVNNVDE